MENEVNKKILNWGPYGACSVSWSFRILMGWEGCIRNAYKRSKTLKIALILPMVYSYPSPRACMCLPIISLLTMKLPSESRGESELSLIWNHTICKEAWCLLCTVADDATVQPQLLIDAGPTMISTSLMVQIA